MLPIWKLASGSEVKVMVKVRFGQIVVIKVKLGQEMNVRLCNVPTSDSR